MSDSDVACIIFALCLLDATTNEILHYLIKSFANCMKYEFVEREGEFVITKWDLLKNIWGKKALLKKYGVKRVLCSSVDNYVWFLSVFWVEKCGDGFV